jgi:hypothetical protein
MEGLAFNEDSTPPRSALPDLRSILFLILFNDYAFANLSARSRSNSEIFPPGLPPAFIPIAGRIKDYFFFSKILLDFMLSISEIFLSCINALGFSYSGSLCGLLLLGDTDFNLFTELILCITSYSPFWIISDTQD